MYSLQVNGLSPERLPDVVNDFEHSLQIYGFSPEWIRWCFLRLPDWENDLIQVWGTGDHDLCSCSVKTAWMRKWLDTFSACKCLPIWISSYVCLSLPDSENVLQHSLQVNGFSPE